MNGSENKSRERIDENFCLHRLLRKRSASKVGQKHKWSGYFTTCYDLSSSQSRRNSIFAWSNSPLAFIHLLKTCRLSPAPAKADSRSQSDTSRSRFFLDGNSLLT